MRPALRALRREAGEATNDELAYVEAERRRNQLARAVREVDDKMTASVVPDWLWVATGFGGVGVTLTAIVFLYPETRIYLIPALILLSIVGFALYGFRSAKELRIRGRLQVERRDLRERREKAKAEAAKLRETLEAQGIDPDGVLVRLSKIGVADAPVILSGHDPSALEAEERQVVLFVSGTSDHPKVQPLGDSPHPTAGEPADVE